MTANLLDLQEIPLHEVEHYHGCFIVSSMSIRTNSEDRVETANTHVEFVKTFDLYYTSRDKNVFETLAESL